MTDLSASSDANPDRVKARPAPSIVGLLSLLLGLGYALLLLIPNGMDPSIFLALGEDAPVQTKYAEVLLGPVRTRESFGHDGKFFFAQANDPLYFETDRHAVVLDRPLYRAQRMLYPLLAGWFGWLGPEVVVWMLPVLNVLAMGLGGWATAVLARGMTTPAWLGLAFPLNFGVISDLDIDGSGIIALLGVVLAVLAAERGRYGLAAGWMTAASLSREVMLAAAVGLALGLKLKRGRIVGAIVLAPAAAAGIWRLYIRQQIGHLPSTGQYQQPFDFPFRGIIDSLPYWRSQPIRGGLVALLMLVLVAFSIRGLRSRHLIAWTALPFIGLSLLLHTAVWREPYDIARALVPVFTAYPLILFAQARGRPVRS